MTYGATQVFHGLARHDGQLTYVSEETIVADGQRPIRAVTFFTDRRGKLLGKLTSEFFPDRRAPAFLVQDFRSGRMWGLRYKGKRPEMFRRIGQAPEQRTPVTKPVTGPLLAGGGLSQFILEELDQLLRQKRLEFWYVFPAQLEQRPCVLRVTHADAETVTVEIVSALWWGRYFFGRQLFTVDRKKLFIRRLEGRSVLLSEDGASLAVEVEFRGTN